MRLILILLLLVPGVSFAVANGTVDYTDNPLIEGDKVYHVDMIDIKEEVEQNVSDITTLESKDTVAKMETAETVNIILETEIDELTELNDILTDATLADGPHAENVFTIHNVPDGDQVVSSVGKTDELNWTTGTGVTMTADDTTKTVAVELAEELVIWSAITPGTGVGAALAESISNTTGVVTATNTKTMSNKTFSAPVLGAATGTSIDLNPPTGTTGGAIKIKEGENATNGGAPESMILSVSSDPDGMTADVNWQFPVGMPASDAYVLGIKTGGIATPPLVELEWQVDGGAGFVNLIAEDTVTLETAEILSTECDSTHTAIVAAGLLASDVVSWTPVGDISGTTGYAPATTGGLIIYVWADVDEINFKVCNPTLASITPDPAVTLNWKVFR